MQTMKGLYSASKFNFKSLSLEMKNSPFQFFLILVLVSMTAIKLSLLGSGFLTFPDEYRYAQSGKAIHDFSQGRYINAMDALFSTRARPGEAFLNMIPNAMQFITAKLFGLHFYESKNSISLFLFNFFIYCFLLLVHFKFSKVILNDKKLALVSVVLFGAITNSYLYLRHALPYDMSLLLFYWIIFKITQYSKLSEMLSSKAFFIGILTFSAYLIYPGYVFLFACIVVLLLFNTVSPSKLYQKFRVSLFFGLGCLLMLLGFELMARLAENSYINDLIRLSKTISQGSFEESFTFILKYLFELEGISGLVLVFLLFVFFIAGIYFVLKGKLQNHKTLLIISIVFILFFVSYASTGYFLHQTVFYGRLIHQFLPFLCVFSIFAFQTFVIGFIKSYKTRNLVSLLLVCILMIDFCFKLTNYQKVSYPHDLEGSELARLYHVNEVTKVFEYANSMEYGGKWRLGVRINRKTVFPPMNQDQKDSVSKIVLVNAGYLFPVKDISLYKAYQAPTSYKLLDSKPHFMNFKAYQYEVYSIEERRNIDAMNLQMRTYLFKTIVK